MFTAADQVAYNQGSKLRMTFTQGNSILEEGEQKVMLTDSKNTLMQNA
jgi:hypothetical protein